MTEKEVGHWNRFLSAVVASSSLEGLKKCVDVALWDIVLG